MGADRAGQGVFAVAFRGSGRGQDLLGGVTRFGRHPGDLRLSLGERAGLVEGHQVGAPDLFHDGGGLDQDAMAAGVGDRGQQRRHGGQHHRAGGSHDHEDDRAQQRFFEGVLEEEHRHGQHQEGAHDHTERVALLDPFDEHLGPGLGG